MRARRGEVRYSRRRARREGVCRACRRARERAKEEGRGQSAVSARSTRRRGQKKEAHGRRRSPTASAASPGQRVLGDSGLERTESVRTHRLEHVKEHAAVPQPRALAPTEPPRRAVHTLRVHERVRRRDGRKLRLFGAGVILVLERLGVRARRARRAQRRARREASAVPLDGDRVRQRARYEHRRPGWRERATAESEPKRAPG